MSYTAKRISSCQAKPVGVRTGDPISLITCTGGRPEAFRLLQRWISAQCYSGLIEWIIIDDCEPATDVWQVEKPMDLIVLRPIDLWRGACTMTRSLDLGLGEASHDKILFIEDDEFYGPRYLETMSTALEHSQLVGQSPARYYHVGKRLFKIFPNLRHASLCQTGIRRALRQRVQALCHRGSPFIDRQLWEAKGLLIEANDVVSIKGMPGRPGIGAGHRPMCGWTPDADLTMLASWLKDESAVAEYARFQEQAA